MIVRSLDGLKEKGSFIYLLALMNEAEGTRLAAMTNGGNTSNTNTLDFAAKIYLERAPAAMAEFAARTGLIMTSSHSQQFRVPVKMRML
ncbi:MAG: hypothetical protein R3B45_07920 [Bdellovibrionota bacterium]